MGYAACIINLYSIDCRGKKVDGGMIIILYFCFVIYEQSANRNAASE